MNYGVTWEPDCWRQFVEIYGGNEVDAVEASGALEWRLGLDPRNQTRRIFPDQNIYLTWIGPYKQHPAVAVSFRIEEARDRRDCVLEKARPTNVPVWS